VSRQIAIICDLSGSMVEGGKRFIMRNLVRSIDQYFRLGFGNASAIRLIAWGNEAKEIDWKPAQDVPDCILACKGSAEAEPLLKMFGGQSEESYALITDGYWSSRTRKAIRQWRDSLPVGILTVIKTGSDANPLLKGENTYSSEDLFAALSSITAGDVNA
jgi:hypothetical protein